MQINSPYTEFDVFILSLNLFILFSSFAILYKAFQFQTFCRLWQNFRELFPKPGLPLYWQYRKSCYELSIGGSAFHRVSSCLSWA
jgi:hypothetical protein